MASHPALGAEERIGETERLGGSDAEEIEICVMVCTPPETPLGRAGAKLQNRNLPGWLRFFCLALARIEYRPKGNTPPDIRTSPAWLGINRSDMRLTISQHPAIRYDLK